ncbi:phenylacetate-CoA oxygenase subunit PaaC [Rhodobacteraceae bacterium]|nr:phenylacetate-CoA oxygenase subunit PaaI [Marinovum sp.]MDA8740580.1 phenylacetate-CoA oxygenase subunit PaaC [Paracoccaceae bacterium]MDG2294530.1 phenylacetate-CoA oxygenase subunit PaaC [Paracoccaceae bacterium]
MGSPLKHCALRLGDNALILGQRLSEWCGHAPALEEDIALANIALDLIGQTQLWLGLAGQLEGCKQSADELAFHREVYDFHNLLLVEQPNRDFGHTMMRQYLFDAFHFLHLKALQTSGDQRVGDIATKAIKEVTYHLERSGETVITLGDGTEESRFRMQSALERLWPFVGEMLSDDEVDHAIADANIGPLPSQLKNDYLQTIEPVLRQATLSTPEGSFAQKGGKSGKMHSEHLGHLLAQMQYLQRAYPDARW